MAGYSVLFSRHVLPRNTKPVHQTLAIGRGTSHLIDQDDMLLLLKQAFSKGITGDLYQDGLLDIIDLITLLNQYGSCLKS